MVARSSSTLSALYLDDETAWLEIMAALIREGRVSELDVPNLAEYLSDMAERDRREVESRLTVLIAHVLKWTHQPGKRSGSWLATILAQRQELQGLFESRTLRNHAEARLSICYERGRELAVAETGLDAENFPADCSHGLDELQELDLSRM